jgi:hypothetical protein
MERQEFEGEGEAQLSMYVAETVEFSSKNVLKCDSWGRIRKPPGKRKILEMKKVMQ